VALATLDGISSAPMAPHQAVRRPLPILIAALALGTLLVACSNGGTPKPVIGGIVGFDRAVATLANDPIPIADPRFACGSSNPFGQELVALDNPATAKTRSEWGDVVPGKTVYMTGTANHTEFFAADLPFTHPFGNDFTFNVKLDKPYAALGQVAGIPDTSGIQDIPPPGSIHTEIDQGLLPHDASDPTKFLEGFVPANGDTISAAGRWIVDCGHGDFHTEVHPPAFLSFAHQQGATTVAHALYDPYRPTELYSPDPSLANDFASLDRFTDPDTQALPTYFANELLRIIEGDHDQIVAHQLLKPNDLRSVSWYVCAPGPKPAGAKLATSYRFTTRAGVTLTVTPDASLGCARFQATLEPQFKPFVPLRKDCQFPWAQFNPELKEALGNPDLDILLLIESKVPAKFVPVVERPVVFDCYDPLAVQTPGPSGGQTGIVSSDQPYPFYGVAEVSWQS
jgi:hypothetical protein